MKFPNLNIKRIITNPKLFKTMEIEQNMKTTSHLKDTL